MVAGEPGMWVVFNLLVVGLLWLDLKVLHKEAHVVTVKEAATWSVIWIALALLFAVGIHYRVGPKESLEFLTGYIIEKTLSVDNLFVFLMIFQYFQVPPRQQPRILHWGILGALVMRFVMIIAGVQLITRFDWVVYLFGALLVYTGVKMAFESETAVDPGKNFALRVMRKVLPFTDKAHGDDFFAKESGAWKATPLFATLVVVEASDLVFAVDSIPAILAITQDTFIVYTSNVFAILGLRALYFLLAGVVGMFRFLRTGVSLILIYVGFKMLLSEFYHVPVLMSLGVISSVLTVSVLASVIVPEEKKGRS